ncbi:MAG: MarR family transcriptional regulator [Verrucomicrobiota bacterium]|nr:MarR family transcriptional regulator [Verrucomicrobiota bacterium]
MKRRTEPGERYEPLLTLLRTAETLWNLSRHFFEHWDLSPSQFNVLNALGLNPAGLSQVELSRSLVMHRSNVTGLVDRLEKRNLVERQTHPEDRRFWRVVLTEEGKKLREEILPDYYTLAEQIWGKIPIKNAHQLASDLQLLSRQAETVSKERFAE